MVWITVNAKKGMRDNLIKILDEPFGHAFTVKQKGCEVVSAEGFNHEGQKSLVNEFDTFTGKIKRIGTIDKNILKELKEKEDPVHNFDAVYVAVGAGGVKNLRLILP